jgi:V/A-type H+/Na+-transporting ATPase subunit E
MAMATKLEEFVARLHADGVETGRTEADRLVREAHAEAERILAAAEAGARERVAQAEARAEALLAQRESELRLAARDAVLQLRATLASSMETLVRHAADAALADPAVVTDILKSVVLEYARADARGARRIEVTVPDALRQPLEEALLRELAGSAAGRAARVDVKGDLAEAGFEYRVGEGGTVEVTTEAVLDVLQRLVRPGLYRLLNGAGPAAPE